MSYESSYTYVEDDAVLDRNTAPLSSLRWVCVIISVIVATDNVEVRKSFPHDSYRPVDLFKSLGEHWAVLRLGPQLAMLSGVPSSA